MKKQIIISIVLFLILVGLTACENLGINDENSYGTDNIVEPSKVREEDNQIVQFPDTQDGFQGDLIRYIEENMEENYLPGAAVAVVQGDTVIFAEGFGYRDVKKELPVTRETLFHIGSTNKSITAMMVAALVDEGLLDWDTAVVEIDPTFRLSSVESTNTVTIRHLLSMQSGIPDEAEDDFDIDYGSAEDLFDYIKDVGLIGAPGETFSYSNISVSLAGYLGVIAAGADSPDLYSGYERVLRERVLDPIGMETAVVRVSEAEKDPNYGKSYLLRGRKAVEAEQEDFDGDPFAPAGSLKVNVMEMADYISTQLNIGIAPNGNRVVSAENLTETWVPGLEDYGMGWEQKTYRGVTVISHEGAFDYYLSIIGFVPDLEIGFVVLTNSEDAGESLIEDCPTFIINYFLNDK